MSLPEEEGACRQAHGIVGGYIAVFPGHRLDASQDRVPSLPRRYENCRSGLALGEGLGSRLDDFAAG